MAEEATPREGYIYRHRESPDDRWSEWKVATLGIDSLVVKGQDSPELWEVVPIIERRPAPDQGERDGLVERLESDAVWLARRWPGAPDFPSIQQNLREAASTIDHQTKALEAADELAQAVREQIEDEPERLSTASTVAFEVYQATRDRTTKGGRNDG